MIDYFLEGADWDDPPVGMAFEAPFGQILDEVRGEVSALRKARDGSQAESGDELLERAIRLYTRAPALVNVLLNYKICVEHGLPLHPTVYYELAEARKYKMDRPIGELESANRLYRSAIGLARAAFRLDDGFPAIAADLGTRLPPLVSGFVYTGGQDKYTWRGADPAKLRRLAAQISAAAQIRAAAAPSIIVAAAHGSIMPALLLAEYLDLPLYFIRFSMFKRHDEAPIVSFADEAYLALWSGAEALLYDEDVAKGTTLEIFSRKLSPLFAAARTACTIRHAGASFKPDHCAKVWWD